MSSTEGQGNETSPKKRLVRVPRQAPSQNGWGGSADKSSQEFFDLLSKWYKRLQSGAHTRIQPNPFWPIDHEKASRLVRILDESMVLEGTWLLRENRVGSVYEAHPEFHRLAPNARVAMWQEVVKLFQYQDEHPEEYFELREIEEGSVLANLYEQVEGL